MPVKGFRRDAHNQMSDTIDRHRFPDDRGIAGHPALPEAVADDDMRLGRGRVVDGRIESRSARQRDA